MYFLNFELFLGHAKLGKRNAIRMIHHQPHCRFRTAWSQRRMTSTVLMVGRRFPAGPKFKPTRLFFFRCCALKLQSSFLFNIPVHYGVTELCSYIEEETSMPAYLLCECTHYPPRPLQPDWITTRPVTWRCLDWAADFCFSWLYIISKQQLHNSFFLNK